MNVKPMTYKEADAVSHAIHDVFHDTTKRPYFCGIIVEVMKIEEEQGYVYITVRAKTTGKDKLEADNERKWMVLIPYLVR